MSHSKATVRIRLLKDIDFMGVLRKVGSVLEAEETHGSYAVQMGYGSWIYLDIGSEAEKIDDDK